MKTLLALVAIASLAFANASVAQTCDLTMSMSMAEKGVVKLVLPPEYKGVTPEQAGDILKRSAAVVNLAQKFQNNPRGEFAFTFDGKNTCGIQTIALTVGGLTHRDAARVWRHAFNVAEGTIRMSEEHVRKGGKGAWGKRNKD